MALDATKPTDNEEVSSHAAYIREGRTEINSLAIQDDTDQTDLTVSAGATSLAVATDLSESAIEVVNISAAAAVNLVSISGGTAGQVKYFIAEDGNITLTNNAVAVVGGVLRLNQIPAIGTLTLSPGDVIALVNVGGSNGFWKELFRTLYVG